MSPSPDRHPPDVPSGFVPFRRGSPFRDRAVGPLFEARGAVTWRLGLRIGEQHLNTRGRVHGGMVSTLADVALGTAITLADPAARPTTVSLNVDYVASAGLGSWMELRPTILRVGQRLAFGRAEIYADDRLVAHANGTFAVTRDHDGPEAGGAAGVERRV